MISTEDVELVRHVVQKILIPCIFAIGVVGNTLSIIVLTRKRMRCSTNVYLTGLAITDLLYLTMCFIMSLKHYGAIRSYKIYWSLMGLFHWLIDSFSYISTYIVVSFTIERYIAVCHPIRGQSLCTEARAKRVIAIVCIVVMLSILSTAFEYQLKLERESIDKVTGQRCIESNSTDLPQLQDKNMTFHAPPRKKYKHLPDHNTNNAELVAFLQNHHKVVADEKYSITTNGKNNCEPVTFYNYESSALGKEDNYRIFYIVTSVVYAVIPMILLITFNSFLVIAVRKSNKLRKEMTNNINSRQVKQKISSMTQENKITITLIAVVILFIICQLPWACISTFLTFKNETDDNLDKFMSNIANLLVAVNAAANFFLYCLLSDKYRKTVRDLITGHSYRRQGTLSSSTLSRQTTLESSWYKHSLRSDSHKRQTSSPIEEDKHSSFKFLNNSQNNHRKPSTIHEEKEHQASSECNVAPSSIRLSNVHENKNNHAGMAGASNNCYHKNCDLLKEIPLKHRPASFGPFDCRLSDNYRKDSKMFCEENFSKPFELLKPSGSSHSLTRSQSLDSTPKIKHSPDCKDFPYNL